MSAVTVIITAYNYGHFIERAATSVTQQSFTEIELLVVDDASTDCTADVVERLQAGDGRIKLIRNASNLGVSACRNIGIAAAKGNWITFLDADDWYDPDRIQLLVETGETTGCDLIADNQFFIDEDCATPWRVLIEGDDQGLTPIDLNGFLDRDRVEVGERTAIGQIKPFLRRRLLTDSGIRYNEDFSMCEDLDFMLRLLEHVGSMLFVNRPLYYYHCHPSSTTAGNRDRLLLGNLKVTYAALGRQCSDPLSPTRQRLLRRAATIERGLACHGILLAFRSREFLALLKEVARRPQAMITISGGAARHLRLLAKRRFARSKGGLPAVRGG